MPSSERTPRGSSAGISPASSASKSARQSPPERYSDRLRISAAAAR